MTEYFGMVLGAILAFVFFLFVFSIVFCILFFPLVLIYFLYQRYLGGFTFPSRLAFLKGRKITCNHCGESAEVSPRSHFVWQILKCTLITSWFALLFRGAYNRPSSGFVCPRCQKITLIFNHPQGVDLYQDEGGT